MSHVSHKPHSKKVDQLVELPAHTPLTLHHHTVLLLLLLPRLHRHIATLQANSDESEMKRTE